MYCSTKRENYYRKKRKKGMLGLIKEKYCSKIAEKILQQKD